ncbi:MAG: hypothetical protein OEZ65_14465 [Gemmatimonadota bacterium]|nr:hypothetical protein [Gemmatimonadota bacterium]
MTRIHRLMLGTMIVAVAACSDLGPVLSPELTIRINSMNDSDITAGIIYKDSNISTQSGNPWGTFIGTAVAECGVDPVGFEITGLSLALDVAGSQNVSVFEDVISGSATVYFLSTQGNDANAVRVALGSVLMPTGTGPVPLTITATAAQLQSLHDRLVGGDFHVGLEAETNRVQGDGFSMDALVTVQTQAICS